MDLNEISFRVRYGETDQMGIVYHVKYADYLEIGRTEWLRSFGITYKDMEDEGIILPVIHLQIDYKKSAKYDDLLTVETRLKSRPMVKIAFDYRIYNESRELLAEAHTVLAFMKKNTLKPMGCPDYILAKLDQ
ncbi:MAG: thioesterase family protein [Bacteroidota bacterium]